MTTEAAAHVTTWPEAFVYVAICAVCAFVVYVALQAGSSKPAPRLPVSPPPVWKYTRTKTVRQPVTKESQTRKKR